MKSPANATLIFSKDEPSDELAGQVLVWALILREVPRTVRLFEASISGKRLEEIRKEERYWPTGDRLSELREQLANVERGESRVHFEVGVVPEGPEKGARFVSVARSEVFGGPERTVTFLLQTDGKILIRTANVGESEERLPTYARAPADTRDAEQLAASLVRRAVELVGERPAKG